MRRVTGVLEAHQPGGTGGDPLPAPYRLTDPAAHDAEYARLVDDLRLLAGPV